MGVKAFLAEFESIKNDRDTLLSDMGELLATIKVNLDRGHLVVNVDNPQFDFRDYVEKKRARFLEIAARQSDE